MGVAVAVVASGGMAGVVAMVLDWDTGGSGATIFSVVGGSAFSALPFSWSIDCEILIGVARRFESFDSVFSGTADNSSVICLISTFAGVHHVLPSSLTSSCDATADPSSNAVQPRYLQASATVANSLDKEMSSDPIKMTASPP